MNPIFIAAIVVCAIGSVCAVMLIAAAKFFAVKENETYTKIRECLPGANCGACGYAGCDGYAKALSEEKGIKANLVSCTLKNRQGRASQTKGFFWNTCAYKFTHVEGTECQKVHPGSFHGGHQTKP